MSESVTITQALQELADAYPPSENTSDDAVPDPVSPARRDWQTYNEWGSSTLTMGIKGAIALSRFVDIWSLALQVILQVLRMRAKRVLGLATIGTDSVRSE